MHTQLMAYAEHEAAVLDCMMTGDLCVRTSDGLRCTRDVSSIVPYKSVSQRLYGPGEQIGEEAGVPEGLVCADGLCAMAERDR